MYSLCYAPSDLPILFRYQTGIMHFSIPDNQTNKMIYDNLKQIVGGPLSDPSLLQPYMENGLFGRMGVAYMNYNRAKTEGRQSQRSKKKSQPITPI